MSRAEAWVSRADPIDYPIVKEHTLDVDPVYRELQRQGPVRVRPPRMRS